MCSETEESHEKKTVLRIACAPAEIRIFRMLVTRVTSGTNPLCTTWCHSPEGRHINIQSHAKFEISER